LRCDGFQRIAPAGGDGDARAFRGKRERACFSEPAACAGYQRYAVAKFKVHAAGFGGAGLNLSRR